MTPPNTDSPSTSALSIDSIPVAYTPPGGWEQWPAAFLADCSEPRPAGAPDLDGYWQTVEVLVDGEVVPEHPGMGHVQRVEQKGDRLIVTAAGIVHDMRCDGTLENGVHDVAEFDKSTEINVIASYEDGVHVLRPHGLDLSFRGGDPSGDGPSEDGPSEDGPSEGGASEGGASEGGAAEIEIKRWRDGEHMMWEYLGFTARLKRLAPADTDPSVALSIG